jgi:methylglyoxal synthase
MNEHPMMTPPTLALVAHDAKKAEMADFVASRIDVIRSCRLIATGTTGARVMERCPELSVTRLKSGPLGGDQQIGALIAEGQISALIFFADPLSPHPHDVDVKALMRLALVYNIPMALNRATADRLIGTFGATARESNPRENPARAPSPVGSASS